MVNQDVFKGKWKEIKGKVKEKFGKLTDDEITEINGRRDQLVGKLQTKYGWAKDMAEKHLKEFEQGILEESESENRISLQLVGVLDVLLIKKDNNKR